MSAGGRRADTVFDVHVVRAIDARDDLPDLAVHAEDDERAGRRCHLDGSEDQAARGIVG